MYYIESRATFANALLNFLIIAGELELFLLLSAHFLDFEVL